MARSIPEPSVLKALGGLENQTHIGERWEKRCGSGIQKKFPDLLIFCEKRIQILALQWIEAEMSFGISRSREKGRRNLRI